MEKLYQTIAKKIFVDQTKIFELLQAYKKTEYLFALEQLGILDNLNDGCTLEDLLVHNDLQESELRYLLDLGFKFGLFTSKTVGIKSRADFKPILELEKKFSEQYTNSSYIADAVKKGIAERQFNQELIPDEIKKVYQEAMYGNSARHRMLHVMRKISSSEINSVLEITSGPGIYIDFMLSKIKNLQGSIFYHFNWSFELKKSVLLAIENRQLIENTFIDERYDCAVINGVLHYLPIYYSLENIISRIKPEGILIIDDLFLPASDVGSEIGIDWLAHGGIYFSHLNELINYLEKKKLNFTIYHYDEDQLFKSIIIKL